MNFRLTSLALSGLLAVPLAANATASSSASISNITYQVWDLSGATPTLTNTVLSFSTLSLTSGSSAYASVFTYSPSATLTQSNTGLFDFEAVSASSAANGEHASASTSGTITNLSVAASGSTNGVTNTGGTALYSASSDTDGEAWWYTGTAFKLPAQTLVVFKGTANVSAQTTTGLNATGYEYAEAQAYLSGYTPENWWQTPSFSASASYSAFTNPSTGLTEYAGQSSVVNNSTIQLRLWNTSSVEQDAYFGATAVASGQSSLVTAVPEPETYAMMLAGLGAIGFMARRRQSK